MTFSFLDSHSWERLCDAILPDEERVEQVQRLNEFFKESNADLDEMGILVYKRATSENHLREAMRRNVDYFMERHGDWFEHFLDEAIRDEFNENAKKYFDRVELRLVEK